MTASNVACAFVGAAIGLVVYGLAISVVEAVLRRRRR